MDDTSLPEDPIVRIEAKIDQVLDEHLPHIALRVNRLEKLFIERQKWAFWSGIGTLVLVIYLVLVR